MCGRKTQQRVNHLLRIFQALGNVDFLMGDQVFVTFNAFVACPEQVRAAGQVAFDKRSACGNQFFSHTFPHTPSLQFGLVLVNCEFHVRKYAPDMHSGSRPFRRPNLQGSAGDLIFAFRAADKPPPSAGGNQADLKDLSAHLHALPAIRNSKKNKIKFRNTKKISRNPNQ